MPVIVIKNYDWRQTRECIIIQVKVNVPPNNVDLFIVDDYLKAHFKPFILELFLWGPVNDEESSCTISDKELSLTLKKVNTEVEWPSVETPELTKDTKKERRNVALQQAQALSEERQKSKSDKRHHLRRQAAKTQLDLQTIRLNKIQDIRDTCRKETMKELDEWTLKYSRPLLDDTKKIIQENRVDYEKPLKSINDYDDTKSNGTSREDEDGSLTDINCSQLATVNETLFNEGDTASENKSNCQDSASIWDSFDSESDEEENKPYRPGEKTVREIISGRRREKLIDNSGQSIPMLRKYGAINVKFSERVFPTPARESFKPLEEEWLTKQAKARRNTGFVAEDLRPEEQDPQWCLDKGEDFMKIGNHLGAISAFSHGIKLNDKMESLYVMRSAAHYSVENYHRCIEDASKALELMVPECEANKEARARCYARRGAAFCQLSAPQHGLPELEAALKLLPDDEQIKRDIFTVKSHFNLNN